MPVALEQIDDLLRVGALVDFDEDAVLVGTGASVAACAAATPLPGTTIACRSIRPFAGNNAKLDCATQAADAITTVPVDWSTATTDHAAQAGEDASDDERQRK